MYASRVTRPKRISAIGLGKQSEGADCLSKIMQTDRETDEASGYGMAHIGYFVPIDWFWGASKHVCQEQFDCPVFIT